MKEPVVVVSGGMGKVGSALVELLRPHTTILIDDPKYYRPPTTTSLLSSVNLPGWFVKCDFLHVCVPYFVGFVEEIKLKQKRFHPEVTIIHSTVPVGTSRKLNAVHSPVMGQHDQLEQSLRESKKFVSGEDPEAIRRAINHLESVGIATTGWHPDIFRGGPELTEALKLLCSVRLYNDLAFYEFAYKFLLARKCDPRVLYAWTGVYNKCNGGLGGKFQRPMLEFPEGKIGGTCVKQNVEMLEKSEGIEMSFLAELELKDDSEDL